MDQLSIGLAGASLLTAGVIKGVTGIGYASCALPFLVMAVGLEAAMGLVIVPALATNILVLVGSGHLREAVRRMWPFYFAILPGIALGLFLLASIDDRQAVACLGVIMLSYSAFALAKPELSLSPFWERWLKVPAGFLNGCMTGLTGSQVMPLLPFVIGLNLGPGMTVQSVNLAVVISSVTVGMGLAATGILTMSVLMWSFLAVVPAAAGAALGVQLRGQLSAERFRLMTLVVFAIMGLGMLLRA